MKYLNKLLQGLPLGETQRLRSAVGRWHAFNFFSFDIVLIIYYGHITFQKKQK